MLSELLQFEHLFKKNLTSILLFLKWAIKPIKASGYFMLR